jgi:LysR family nitrogen assimilation transcriptional regulator
LRILGAMEMRQLRYFVEIVEAGSFSRAAIALGMAQPSLSRQISLLESEVGQRLLTRNGRGVVTTEAGQCLLVHARTILDIAQRAVNELQDIDESPSGRISIGMPPRVAVGLSAPLVEAFRKRFPRAVITVLEGLSVSMRASLIAGEIDMALLFDPAPSGLLNYETLSRERLLIVGPPGSRFPPKVGIPALASYPMVLPSPPNAIRGLLDTRLKPRGVDLQVLAEVGAVRTVLALVNAGMGCTVLPESALMPGVDDALPRSPVGPPTIWNTLVLATPAARPATRLQRGTAALLRDLDFRKK